MSQIQVTLNSLLDDSLQALQPWQRWAIERNFRRFPANREKVLAAVEVQIAKSMPAMMATMDDAGFNADTPFLVSETSKGELLDIILENLPAILAAIIKILGLFVLFLACALGFQENAAAQNYPSSGGYISVGGGCTGSAKAKANYGCTGSAAKAYGSTGSAVKSSYGCTGSAVAKSYGSTGSSAVRDLRPLRSILEKQPVRTRVKAAGAVVVNAAANLGSAYQVALASAQYRAANRIKGHARHIEAGCTTGVGFSTSNPNPRTCFGVGGNYVSVRGVDGWYSTKVL